MAERADSSAGPREGAVRGWLAARLAAGLLIAAMAYMAWAMVNFGWFLRRYLNIRPFWNPWLHFHAERWAAAVVPGLLAAAALAGLLGAVRGHGRFRWLGAIEAGVSAAALMLSLLIYW